ncbi:MAG: LITAF-like zinc ribbon domain-containing protein [Acidobacteria bacterium]|nr:LITAF-like zinc ribbon domain-containing protein [Acidobacteriota bacterium]
MQCQNCGQINTENINFCRFCGTKIGARRYSGGAGFPPPPQLKPNYEESPPRPYSWKTDEFQIGDDKAPKRQQFERAQNFQPPQHLERRPFQGTPARTHDYRCPRCGSQLFPRIVRQISTGGWIVFAVLLVFFFPLFWVGLLIKEEISVCPVCNLRVG